MFEPVDSGGFCKAHGGGYCGSYPHLGGISDKFPNVFVGIEVAAWRLGVWGSGLWAGRGVAKELPFFIRVCPAGLV